MQAGKRPQAIATNVLPPRCAGLIECPRLLELVSQVGSKIVRARAGLTKTTAVRSANLTPLSTHRRAPACGRNPLTSICALASKSRCTSCPVELARDRGIPRSRLADARCGRQLPLRLRGRRARRRQRRPVRALIASAERNRGSTSRSCPLEPTSQCVPRAAMKSSTGRRWRWRRGRAVPRAACGPAGSRDRGGGAGRFPPEALKRAPASARDRAREAKRR